MKSVFYKIYDDSGNSYSTLNIVNPYLHINILNFGLEDIIIYWDKLPIAFVPSGANLVLYDVFPKMPIRKGADYGNITLVFANSNNSSTIREIYVTNFGEKN